MIGIISDTHDNVENIKKAVEIFKEKGVEFVVHLGDVVAPTTLQFFKGLNLKLVRGNCDGDIEMIKKKCEEFEFEYYDKSVEFEVGGKRFVGVHGNDEVLLNNLILSGYDYVLFGHTHEKTDRQEGNTRVINPGAHYYTTMEKTIVLIDPVQDLLVFVEII